MIILFSFFAGMLVMLVLVSLSWNDKKNKISDYDSLKAQNRRLLKALCHSGARIAWHKREAKIYAAKVDFLNGKLSEIYHVLFAAISGDIKEKDE